MKEIKTNENKSKLQSEVKKFRLSAFYMYYIKLHDLSHELGK